MEEKDHIYLTDIETDGILLKWEEPPRTVEITQSATGDLHCSIGGINISDLVYRVDVEIEADGAAKVSLHVRPQAVRLLLDGEVDVQLTEDA